MVRNEKEVWGRWASRGEDVTRILDLNSSSYNYRIGGWKPIIVTNEFFNFISSEA